MALPGFLSHAAANNGTATNNTWSTDTPSKKRTLATTRQIA